MAAAREIMQQRVRVIPPVFRLSDPEETEIMMRRLYGVDESSAAARCST